MRFPNRLLLLLWVLLIAASCIHFALTEKTGSGFTRGTNRVEIFLRWQAAALIVAWVNLRLVRGRKPTRGERRLASLPLWLQLGPAAVIVLLVIVSALRA